MSTKSMKEFKNRTRNNDGGKKYNKKPQKVERFKPTTFRKNIVDIEMDNSGNVYMDYILTDLYNLCPEIKQFFDYESFGLEFDQLTADDCKNMIINQFTQNVPEMKIGGENPFWSIQVSSNRCVVKTDKGFQFGWTLKIRRDNRDEYEGIELSYTAFSPKALPDDTIVSRFGWEEITY